MAKSAGFELCQACTALPSAVRPVTEKGAAPARPGYHSLAKREQGRDAWLYGFKCQD